MQKSVFVDNNSNEAHSDRTNSRHLKRSIFSLWLYISTISLYLMKLNYKSFFSVLAAAGCRSQVTPGSLVLEDHPPLVQDTLLHQDLTYLSLQILDHSWRPPLSILQPPAPSQCCPTWPEQPRTWPAPASSSLLVNLPHQPGKHLLQPQPTRYNILACKVNIRLNTLPSKHLLKYDHFRNLSQQQMLITQRTPGCQASATAWAPPGTPATTSPAWARAWPPIWTPTRQPTLRTWCPPPGTPMVWLHSRVSADKESTMVNQIDFFPQWKIPLFFFWRKESLPIV